MQLIVADAAESRGRVGFVISRKALPRAVDRNRLRRQVRALLTRDAPAFARVDLVVRVRPMKRTDLPAAALEARALLARVAASSASATVSPAPLPAAPSAAPAASR